MRGVVYINVHVSLIDGYMTPSHVLSFVVGCVNLLLSSCRSKRLVRSVCGCEGEAVSGENSLHQNVSPMSWMGCGEFHCCTVSSNGINERA